MREIHGRFPRRRYKRYFPLERKRFFWPSCRLSQQFFSLRSPFRVTLHKKVHEIKSLLLNRAVKWAILPWTGAGFEGLSGTPLPKPPLGVPFPSPPRKRTLRSFANTAFFRDDKSAQLENMVPWIKQSFLCELAIDWILKRPRHVRLRKWDAKEPSLLREFAVCRMWTFERVWFSDLVACMAETLLSPFSAPSFCRFHACYEERRIGVGQYPLFLTRLKGEKREHARTWKISRQLYDEMKAWSRLKRRLSVRYCVFCCPLLL